MMKKILLLLLFFSALCAEAQLVAVGGAHSLAVCPNGKIMAWGLNSKGQLGDGTLINRRIPTEVQGLTNIIAVAAGTSHSIALTTDSSVWTWGNNYFGQVGDGTMANKLLPAKVPGLTSIVAIAGGGGHTLALRADGTVWAWGDNRFRQSGDSVALYDSLPNQVPVINNVIAIAAGGSHGLALKSDSTVWAWGWNGLGQLGDGGSIAQDTPVQVNGLVKVVAIAAGGLHSTAIASDSIVFAWGNGYLGQAGYIANSRQIYPKWVEPSILTSAISVASGFNHNLLLKADSTLWSWGGVNEFGQLGDTIVLSVGKLHKVLLLSGVVAIAGGPASNHCLAIKSDGTLWAWGANDFGQIGDSTLGQRNIPVLITRYCNFGIGVEEISSGVNGLEIYPNPARDRFMIYDLQFMIGEKALVEVYDVLGEKVYEAVPGNNKGIASPSTQAGVSLAMTVDVSGWAKGMYFVKVSDGKKMLTGKVVVE